VVQNFVFDVNQIERFERGQFFTRHHRRNRIADVAYAIGAKRLFILADRNDSVFNRQILSGKDEMNKRPDALLPAMH